MGVGDTGDDAVEGRGVMVVAEVDAVGVVVGEV